MTEMETKLLDALKGFVSHGCPVCSGDCASANPPVTFCPMTSAQALIAEAEALRHSPVAEDCGASFYLLTKLFGEEVSGLVEMLTDVSRPAHGNRAARKALDREHTANCSPAAATIKLADLIDNTKSIVERDPEFAKVYLEEKRLLLEVLTHGDPTLLAMARELANREVSSHE